MAKKQKLSISKEDAKLIVHVYQMSCWMNRILLEGYANDMIDWEQINALLNLGGIHDEELSTRVLNSFSDFKSLYDFVVSMYPLVMLKNILEEHEAHECVTPDCKAPENECVAPECVTPECVASENEVPELKTTTPMLEDRIQDIFVNSVLYALQLPCDIPMAPALTILPYLHRLSKGRILILLQATKNKLYSILDKNLCTKTSRVIWEDFYNKLIRLGDRYHLIEYEVPEYEVPEYEVPE